MGACSRVGGLAAVLVLLFVLSSSDYRSLLSVGLRMVLGKKFSKVREGGGGPFTATHSRRDSPAVRVAVVGGGMAGLMAAYTLHKSNLRRRCASDGNCEWPRFNVTLFEASSRVGGHSWTVHFPLRGQHEGRNYYPVDVGYAYNPTMWSYEIIRNFERMHGLHMKGPLQQRVAVYKQGFTTLPAAEEKRLDAECDRFMRVIQFVRDRQLLSKVPYRPISVILTLTLTLTLTATLTLTLTLSLHLTVAPYPRSSTARSRCAPRYGSTASPTTSFSTASTRSSAS